MTTPAIRRQQRLSVATRREGHPGATWTNEQLRARGKRIRRQLIAADTPAEPAAEHQIGDFEAEP
jgi:hypothetical protein